MDIAGYLKSSFGIPLNQQQVKALQHREGPGIVLAVAGSGKTTVLVSRTANLILNHGISPERIYTMTFSRSASRDMESRFHALFGGMTDRQPKFSTIHSFAYRLVAMVYRKKQKRISLIEGGEEKGISKMSVLSGLYQKHCREYPTDEKLEQIQTLIGFVKNRRIPPESFQTDENTSNEKGFKEIYRDYEAFKSSKGLLDYDDLLMEACGMLKENPLLLKKFRQQYRYIQVDEFQDTSPLQLDIIHQLAGPDSNLFVVGDDDQGIYEWRGTEPRVMMDFPKRYPGAVLYFMEENFRSGERIIRLANRILTCNQDRYEKTLFTKKDPGNVPQVRVEKNEQSQYRNIVETLEKDGSPAEWAVLYRNNVSAVPLMKVLDEAGIPFYLKDPALKFFQHWVLRDLQCFLDVAQNPRDTESFSRIYYKNDAYLSKELFFYGESMVRKRSTISSVFQGMLMFPHLKRYQGRKIEEMEERFKELNRLSSTSLVEYIDQQLGYGEYLKRKGTQRESSFDSGRGVLETLKAITDGIMDIEEYRNAIREFVRMVEKGKHRRGRGVTLSTLHSAKGLEFPKVYMIDLLDGLFPGNTGDCTPEVRAQRLEEERRLFYVGVTRAKDRLILSTMEQRFQEWTEPSLFLSEIGKEVKEEHWKSQWKTRVKEKISRLGMTFRLNQTIRHRTFGEGVIIDVISQERITVDFKENGKKTLLTHYLVEKNLLMEGRENHNASNHDEKKD